MQAARTSSNRLGRVAYALSFACFLVYVLNVVAGKATVALGWRAPWRFGDVAEFVIVVACVVCFVVGIVRTEARSVEDGH
jgi:membrane protein YdbS with pleckstrin-like domain